MSREQWSKLHDEGHLSTNDYNNGFDVKGVNSTETKARTHEGVAALNASMERD